MQRLEICQTFITVARGGICKDLLLPQLYSVTLSSENELTWPRLTVIH
jgi:hypothetical protein